jgi:16S rRNA (guanine(966)-N(2))-methyltransferase RsmD
VTRIVAGRYGGRRIAAPAGRDTRPTSDRVREALFGSLGALDGVRFLDLYAGSGAIGLEAASRGAAHVLLVESDPKAARTARDNVTLLGAVRQVTMAVARVEQTLQSGPPGDPYDVVFADPPYAVGEPEITAVLSGLVEHGWLAPDATVVIERSRRSPEPAWVPGITAERSRRYGDTALWYGRRS